MYHQRKRNNRIKSITRVVVVTFLLVILFVATVTTAMFVLMGSSFNLERVIPIQQAVARAEPTATAAPRPLVTPIAAAMTTFRSVALGFAIDYPADWHKEEKTLRVIFSPASARLNMENLQDAAIWVGIPADESFEPANLLTKALADFPPNVQILQSGSMNVAAQPWLSTQISFHNQVSGEPNIGRIITTNRNNVGYLIVAVAPAQQWPAIEPIFQGMINSFRFTQEVVIRPTDATPPPTPTPTPTPRIYIVQPGDTLSGIALEFGVTVEALANRNGIDRPENLRSGQRLIIPTRRR